MKANNSNINANDDIFKELEDYVQEKKQTNKYLDDISDIDTVSNSATAMQIKNKERMSKKYKEMMAADKDLMTQQLKKDSQQAK